jgi:hypothetical protein
MRNNFKGSTMGAAALAALILTGAGSANAASPVPSSRPNFYGQPAPPAAVERVIRLDNDARWINVTQNETVRIERGGQRLDWTFSTWTTSSFDLSQVAPAGFVAPGAVRVYLQPDPRYTGR